MRSYRLEFSRMELDWLRRILGEWWTATDAALYMDKRDPQFIARLRADIEQIQHFDDRHVHADYAELPERARPNCRTLGCTSSALTGGFCDRHGGDRADR